jgi:uncharacterized protein
MMRAKLRSAVPAATRIFGAVVASIGLALSHLATGPVLAQAPANFFNGRSYITPFPQSDRYQVHVIGDGLAEGLAEGLQAAFEKDGTIKVVKSSKSSAGLTRPDPDVLSDAAALAKQQGMTIAVIMIGSNDVRNFKAGDGSERWGTDGWRTAYAKEVDKLIKILKDNNVAIYWVGLPVMSNPKTNEAMGVLNDIFRERTYIAGVRFVDTWNGFIDQSGGFSAYGPDLSGQTKRLREADGVFFTAPGNRKLANYVEVLLRRDLAAAKAERNIPLAGDDEEQSRLVPKAAEDAKTPQSEAGVPPKAAGDTPAPEGAPNGGQAPAQVAATQPQAEQPKATLTPPAQLQVPRQLSFRPGDAPSGETIVGDITGDVTALATVSPLNDLSANLGARRLPLQERPYYKALIKGQALQPKPGRADDFKWPKS